MPGVLGVHSWFRSDEPLEDIGAATLKFNCKGARRPQHNDAELADLLR